MSGWTDVDLSLSDLWERFIDVEGWPAWNACIDRAHCDGGLRLGAELRWVFNPVRPWYPYRLPASALITAYEPHRLVTWEVRLAGLHALHSYMFDDGADADPSTSRFGSWEIAEGVTYRLLRRPWMAHFRYVLQASLAGARSLPTRRIRLRRSGTPAPGRLPLLVIPGIDGRSGSVAPIVDRLGNTREVVLADYHGEANSSLDGLVDELAAIAPPRFDLLGQSIGTWIAAALAWRLGDRVRTVTLVSPFTRGRDRALRLSSRLTRATPKSVYRITTPALMALLCGPVGDGGSHPFLRGVADSEPEGVARRTRWQVGYDATDDLRRMRQPTLVLMGGADRFVPRRKQLLAFLHATFDDPPSRLVVIPKAGHVLLPTEAVNRAVHEVEQFLR